MQKYRRRHRREITYKTEPATLIGRRVEIPVHYDLWMRGARTGIVTSWRAGKPGVSDCVLVKMDHPQVRKRVKVWRLDWDYMRLL